jgi:threonine dehydrogenase-like Zn-dependent dehydrogenase
MKAAIFQGKGAVELGQRPDPTIKVPTDAVVRVALTCVCGSDLWYYRGQSDYPQGSPIGHEFVGVVEHVGDGVQNIAKGDLVITPFFYSDGTCPNCRAGITCLYCSWRMGSQWNRWKSTGRGSMGATSRWHPSEGSRFRAQIKH